MTYQWKNQIPGLSALNRKATHPNFGKFTVSLSNGFGLIEARSFNLAYEKSALNDLATT